MKRVVKEALRAAAATRELGRVMPRPLRMHRWLVVALIPALVGGAVHRTVSLEAIVGLLLTTLVALIVILVVMRDGVTRHNAAVAVMLAGDLDGAAARFRALLARPTTEQLVAFSLYQLGTIARRRDPDGGSALLLRAAYELERARFRRTNGSIEGLIAADLALSLASEGKLEEAAAVLAAPHVTTYPMALALLARSRAYVALRTGRPEDAVAALDAEGALIRNTLTANDDALAETLCSVALARTEGVYRNAPRAAHAVVVDAEARAYVTRFLPEATSLLADA